MSRVAKVDPEFHPLLFLTMGRPLSHQEVGGCLRNIKTSKCLNPMSQEVQVDICFFEKSADTSIW